MIEYTDLYSNIEKFIPVAKTIVTIILIFVFLNFIITFIEKRLLKEAKTKKQISNIEIFSRVLKYMLFLILVIIAIFSYAGSWTGLGIGIGLFSAALGWALQKPITGIAAWIMLIVKRPFDIGDRIIVGAMRGDVIDITLTHIYLQEIGGLVPSEENSGRIIMVPNSILFEQNIINYTSQDEYILDQVIVAVTYESNLEKAKKIVFGATKKYTDEFFDKTKRDPYIRTYFQPSGINIHTRYFAPVKRLQEVSSNVTQEIFERIRKARDVEIAYPHTEIVYRKK